MSEIRYIGVDPGKSGGLAVIWGVRRVAIPMPETEADVYAWLNEWATPDSRAVVEKVASSPQMGVRSAFTFGRNYGMLLMGLTCSGVPFSEISPQRWQKELGCLSKGDKNVTKRRAQQLFPDLKITHAIADSLLLAEYARRIHHSS